VFVDAPVSGSEGPAQAGQLVILASGPHQVRDLLAPVFGVLGRTTAWLGPAGHGTRAKLVLNNWLADLTEATAETLSFAQRLGLDPAEIVDLLQSTPLGAPYAVQKARGRTGTHRCFQADGRRCASSRAAAHAADQVTQVESVRYGPCRYAFAINQVGQVAQSLLGHPRQSGLAQYVNHMLPGELHPNHLSGRACAGRCARPP
jgi:hypothetical protein